MSKFNPNATFEIHQSFRGGKKYWKAEFNSLAELRRYGRNLSRQYCSCCRVCIQEYGRPENYWCWNNLY